MHMAVLIFLENLDFEQNAYPRTSSLGACPRIITRSACYNLIEKFSYLFFCIFRLNQSLSIALKSVTCF